MAKISIEIKDINKNSVQYEMKCDDFEVLDKNGEESPTIQIGKKLMQYIIELQKEYTADQSQK